MRKLKLKNATWLKIHFYSGLFSAFFLLMIGFSALQFNHHFEWFKARNKNFKVWESQISVADTVFTNVLLDSIAREIGLFGYHPWWQQSTDSAGNFHYSLERPGKRYENVILVKEQKVVVTEYNKGFWAVLVSLHTSTSSGHKQPMLRFWSWFSNVATVLAFVVVVSSFILWYRRSFKTRKQWFVALFIAAVSVFYILYIWLVG